MVGYSREATRMNHHLRRVRLVEVGPRDGLQNEALPVPVEAKIAIIARRLSGGGHSAVEAGQSLHVAQMGAANGQYRRSQ